MGPSLDDTLTSDILLFCYLPYFQRHLGKHLGDVAPLTDPSGKEGTSSTEATGAGSLPAVGSLRSDAVVNQTPQRVRAHTAFAACVCSHRGRF